MVFSQLRYLAIMVKGAFSCSVVKKTQSYQSQASVIPVVLSTPARFK